MRSGGVLRHCLRPPSTRSMLHALSTSTDPASIILEMDDMSRTLGAAAARGH